MVDLTPVGISDLYTGTTRDWPDEIWYWCRGHEQAHKVGENCREQLGGPGGGSLAWRMPSNDECIDVGPFMSEREAKRLSDPYRTGSVKKPLGREVEQ